MAPLLPGGAHRHTDRTELALCSLGEHLGEGEVERWRAAIVAFRNLPVGIPSPWTRWSEHSVDPRIHPDSSDRQADRIREAFKIECARNRKLQAIGEILARRREPIATTEEIVLEAGELAAPIYARIWASCSNAERLVLYYIARDGFLNAKASPEIRELCRKGLLLPKEYRLVNESFRNFVLEVRDPKLVDRMQARRESRWEAFPIILQALVYGLGAIVVVTLAVSQKETLQSFAGYLTAIVGALGTAGKLLSARGGTDRTTNA